MEAAWGFDSPRARGRFAATNRPVSPLLPRFRPLLARPPGRDAAALPGGDAELEERQADQARAYLKKVKGKLGDSSIYTQSSRNSRWFYTT